MSKIFISYRRDDSAGHAGRLFDRLCARLGKDSVFMDVEGIEAGLDFVETIEAAVGSCDVLLAVIGRAWLDIKDSQGLRRLEDPRDFIRLETVTALTRGIRVIPVLIEGVAMPAEASLPDVLKPLSRRQSVDLRDSRWEADIENLIQVLEHLLGKASSQGPTSGTGKPVPVVDKPTGNVGRSAALWWGAGAALIVAGMTIAYLLGPVGEKQPTASPAALPEAKAPARPDAMPPASAPTPSPSTPASSAEKIVTPAAGPSHPAVEQPAVSPPASAKIEPQKAEPPPARAERVAPPAAVAVPRPKVAPAERPPVAKTTPPVSRPAVESAAPPPAAAAGKTLKIAVVTMGEPTSRSFWASESDKTYSAKMAVLYDESLRKQVPGKIEVNAGSDRKLAKPLMPAEGSRKLEQQICDSTGASVIFVAVIQESFSLSALDSPHFPELRLKAIGCTGGGNTSGGYNLAPRNGDAFPFARDMAQVMSDFVRQNLPLLQSAGGADP